MSTEKESIIIVRLLERTTNLLGAQAPEDAAKLMMAFIHHAAHIAKSLTDAETICGFLDSLSAHLPVCTDHTVVERHEGDDPLIHTNTTKH